MRFTIYYQLIIKFYVQKMKYMSIEKTGFIFLAIKFSQLYFFMMQTFRDEKFRLVKVTMKNLRW